MPKGLPNTLLHTTLVGSYPQPGITQPAEAFTLAELRDRPREG